MDWLARMQVRPRDGKPLVDFRGNGRDRELTRIVEEIWTLSIKPGQLQNIDEALTELEDCLSRGEISREHVLEDPDWEALHEDPRTKELTKEPRGLIDSD